MLRVELLGFVLVAVTVVIHAVGLGVLLRNIVKYRAATAMTFWPITLLLIRMTCYLLLIHLTEMAAWALLYFCTGALPDIESAFYFSGVTYATIGYGDLVLAKPWRILAPMEGLTGNLMTGLSASLFFALVFRVISARFLETKES